MQQSMKDEKNTSHESLDVDLIPTQLNKPIVSSWFMAGNIVFINSKPTKTISGNLS
jgi:hypothetical protein